MNVQNPCTSFAAITNPANIPNTVAINPAATLATCSFGKRTANQCPIAVQPERNKKNTHQNQKNTEIEGYRPRIVYQIVMNTSEQTIWYGISATA
mmetsp:Transcript_10258/g.19246  ORF Transcript_10258/g.19246 Transcript_10258/m.19246 type:complete len:95 (-) Transcript_10258:1159-1443(-)